MPHYREVALWEQAAAVPLAVGFVTLYYILHIRKQQTIKRSIFYLSLRISLLAATN